MPGGQGQSWAAGGLVFKPLTDASELAWLGPALAAVVEDGFRISRPVHTIDGAWTSHGWGATTWVDGTVGAEGRWGQLLAAATAFHDAIAHIPRPSGFDRRQDRWARADRAAWDEDTIRLHSTVAPLAERLRPLSKRRDEQSQLVHCDLSGNTLFAEGAPPAVIDFSLYWRPRSYAAGIVMADALLWSPDGLTALTSAWHSRDLTPVARGLLFRLLDHNERLSEEDLSDQELAPFEAAITALKNAANERH